MSSTKSSESGGGGGVPPPQPATSALNAKTARSATALRGEYVVCGEGRRGTDCLRRRDDIRDPPPSGVTRCDVQRHASTGPPGRGALAEALLGRCLAVEGGSQRQDRYERRRDPPADHDEHDVEVDACDGLGERRLDALVHLCHYRLGLALELLDQTGREGLPRSWRRGRRVEAGEYGLSPFWRHPDRLERRRDAC